MLEIGSKAPDFSAPDQAGKIHNLSDYRGKYLLLYFYPKDNTPGCTREACSFRDNYAEFEKIKANVLGVSKDSVESHAKFSDKFDLPFPILSDSDKKIISDYQVEKRVSYLISPDGKIAKAYASVKPDTHVAQVIKDLENQE